MGSEDIDRYWERTITNLVEAIGIEDARLVTSETAKRMGEGGTTRQWTVMLLKVLGEYSRARGYTTTTALAAALSKQIEKPHG